MVRLLGIASLALAVISSVSGHVIRHRGAPAGWQSDILQSYGEYHARYLKWKCEDKHNTTYFDTCCHPLLKGEPLSVLDALNCDSECEDGSSSVPNPTSYSPAAMTPSPQQYIPTSSPPVPATSSHQQDKPTSSLPAYTPSPEPPKSVEPSSTPAPASPKSSPTSSPSGGDSNDWKTGGVATYFLQNGVAGACGTVHQDTDLIAAMDSQTYNKDLCGRKVEIVAANSKSVTVTIADSCPTCFNINSIDLSVSAFEALAALSVGELDMKWRWA